MEPTKTTSSDSPAEAATLIPPEATAPVVSPEGRPATGISLRAYVVLVAAGAFITTFAQQRVLGQYPTLFLLKNGFHLKKEDVAVFFFWATFAWNLKPIVGILTDAFPMFGTRRRHYMMLGSFLAGIMWAVMGYDHSKYSVLLLCSVLLNVAMVFSSTVMGGLMVEAGQAFGAPGRMASLRQFVQNVQGIVAPLIGGYLADKAFGWTAGVGAASLIALGFITAAELKERRTARAVVEEVQPRMSTGYVPPAGVVVGIVLGLALSVLLFLDPKLRNLGISLAAMIGVIVLLIGLVMTPTSNATIAKAQLQFVEIFRSRTLWMAVGMLFLVYTVPGLNTALTYRQNDVLKMSTEYIGMLDAISYGVGAIAAGAYFFLCRKFSLRVLLVFSLVTNGLMTLLYLSAVYTKPAAPFIHALLGVTFLSELSLMDLAVRSTPKGCEALGFALMMSIRNFGIAVSDIIGTKMIDQYKWEFNNLVLLNASTTLLCLVFLPLLPRVIMNRKEGEATT